MLCYAICCSANSSLSSHASVSLSSVPSIRVDSYRSLTTTEPNLKIEIPHMSPEQSQYIWRKTIPHIEVGMGSGVFTSHRSARFVWISD